jgi:hypothetical protein
MRVVSADMVNEQYEPTENDERVLNAFKDGRERGEPWGRANPRWLIDQTGLDKGNVEFSLRQLTSAGWLRRVARGCYEFVSDPREAEDDLPAASATAGHSAASRRSQSDRLERQNGDGSESASLREEMEAALKELDVPGRKAKVEYARRQAVKWAWEYLRDADGVVTTRELANSTFAEFWDEPINYTTNERYPGYGLWDGCVRDVLKQLPGVVDPGPRGSRWRFEES